MRRGPAGLTVAGQSADCQASDRAGTSAYCAFPGLRCGGSRECLTSVVERKGARTDQRLYARPAHPCSTQSARGEPMPLLNDLHHMTFLTGDMDRLISSEWSRHETMKPRPLLPARNGRTGQYPDHDFARLQRQRDAEC